MIRKAPFKMLVKVFTIARYSLCLKKFESNYDQFTEQEKCNYVIASYVFAFIILGGSVLIIYGIVPDSFYTNVIKNPAGGVEVFGILLVGVGTLGHCSSKKIHWKKMPKHEALGEQISLAFHTAAIVVTLHAACGLLSL